MMHPTGGVIIEMIDRRKYMDDGTKAIIREISREIADTQYEKINEYIKEGNKYLDKEFTGLKEQIGEIKNTIDEMKINGCISCVNHKKEHKEKEKKMVRTVTIISTAIPTFILLGGWVKSVIIGWVQK